MDDNGGIGMGYAKSSSSTSPSACFTGRNGYDPINQFTYTETVAAAGSGAQTFTNRFGDYSHTSLDPTDGTIFWHTGEYLSSGSQRTKIFSFRIPYNTAIDTYGSSEVFAVAENDFINVKGSNLPEADELVVDLFDIRGQLITGKTVTTNAGSFETTFTTRDLAAGMYLVRVGKTNTTFQKVIKVTIQ